MNTKMFCYLSDISSSALLEVVNQYQSFLDETDVEIISCSHNIIKVECGYTATIVITYKVL